MRKPSRRDVVIGLPTAAAALAGAAPFARAADPPLTFLAVGDWGRDGGFHQRDVAVEMGRAAQQLASRFVVSTGDNFYESGVASVLDPKWKTSFEDVYTAPSLQTPWYAVLGNHDYGGAPQAQVDYAATSGRWRMPSRYYKVSGDAVGAPQADLFFIDTTPLVHGHRSGVADEDAAAQLAWLDRELGRSQAPWKLVFGHHTLYSGGSEHGNTLALIEQVQPLLERHGVQAYVNGHEHDLQHLRVGQVDYICSGAGSEVRPTGSIAGTRFALSRSGFAVFALGRDSLDLQFRDYTGATVYAASIERSRTT